MVSGSFIVNNGAKIIMNRTFKASPDYTAPTRFKIGTGTTTPTVSDTDMVTPITAWYSGGDYKNAVSGYPSFDYTNKQVTMRGYVASTEANSNSITEQGWFNTDGTVLMFDRQVFTAISKTNTDEIAFVTKFKVINT